MDKDIFEYYISMYNDNSTKFYLKLFYLNNQFIILTLKQMTKIKKYIFEIKLIYF